MGGVVHGGRNRPEYQVWRSMKRRCLDPKNAAYSRYGAIGISVFPDWIDSFAAFFAHIGERPSSRHSIDRFPDAGGNYEPGNVRWATPEQQNRNRRAFNVIVEFRGERKSIGEWIELLRLKRARTYWRLKRGWMPEAAFTVPDGNQNRPIRPAHSAKARANLSTGQKRRREREK